MAETTPLPSMERMQPGGLERVEQQLEQVSHTREAPRVAPTHPVLGSAAFSASTAASQQVAPKTPLREDIEAALADDRIRELYAALEPSVQQAFRVAAERLAARIEVMIAKQKLNIDDVHEEIVDWLHIIPTINRWFLVQEAKVKTDAMLKLLHQQ
ncbi:MAG: hypothetical protein ABIG71_04730 [Candidatus Uhrbacteria bacterium]